MLANAHFSLSLSLCLGFLNEFISPLPDTTHRTHKWFRYLEESAGIVLFEDFQAVLHHAGGLTELHGAVGDLIAHHLITDHTSHSYMFESGAFKRLRAEAFSRNSPAGADRISSSAESDTVSQPGSEEMKANQIFMDVAAICGRLTETR